MPVEGQWERARTPLSRRDRRVVAVVAGIAAAAAAAGGLVVALRPDRAPTAACVTFQTPSTMGGATFHECGAAARAFCVEQGGRDASIAATCRRHGLAVGSDS